MIPRLLDLFDQCPGVLLITDQQGVVVYVNKAVEQKYGYCYAEVVGTKPGALWGQRMPTSFYQYLWKRLAIQKQPFIGALKNQAKTGDKIIDQIYIFPILDRQRAIRYFVELSLPHATANAAVEKFYHQGLELFQYPARFQQFFLPWVAEWLVNDHTRQAYIRQLISVIAHTASLHELLYHELIAPMREALHLRYEDYSLVAAAKHNAKAFADIYTKYYKTIYYYTLQHTNYATDIAEELTQEIFLKAFEHLDAFHLMNASYRTYLLQIAHNTVINYYRKPQSIPIDDAAQLGDADNFAEHVAERIDDQHNVEYLLASLRPLERTILQLKYQQELSVREIAALVGKSENAVKLILSRTRQKLRTHDTT